MPNAVGRSIQFFWPTQGLPLRLVAWTNSHPRAAACLHNGRPSGICHVDHFRLWQIRTNVITVDVEGPIARWLRDATESS